MILYNFTILNYFFIFFGFAHIKFLYSSVSFQGSEVNKVLFERGDDVDSEFVVALKRTYSAICPFKCDSFNSLVPHSFFQ